jgi:hypothetical protein
VITHEAVRMTDPIIALDKIFEGGRENGYPAISPGCQVIKRSRKLNPQWSRHELLLTKIQDLTPAT